MEDITSESRIRRTLFVRPGAQFKVFIFAAVLGQLILSITFVSYLYFIDHMITSGAESFQGSLYWMKMVVLVMTALLVGVSFMIMGLITQRIFGPTVPMLRLIEELKDGKYGGTRTLRTSDEMKQVMDELNNLSQILKKRHPSEN